MNVLAHEIAITPHGRLGTWAAKAWRRLGWRHLLLALLIVVVQSAIHPLGGTYFPPTGFPAGDSGSVWLHGFGVIQGISIVYCLLIADEAFNDGVPAVRAYGLTAVLLSVLLPLGKRLFAELMVVAGLLDRVPGSDEGVAQLLWWLQVYLYESGFGLSIYGYWRVTQRAMQQAHAAETEHVGNEQRVQTARLLALQSRVEPQMLFDALGRVSELHGGDPQVADALLADLIAMLRAMQPSAKMDTSTVEREFALVEAWLRVMRSVGHDGMRVHLQMTSEAASVGIAPMLVLPLVRAVLALPRAGGCAWLLNACVAGRRVVIALQATPEAGNAPLASADFDLSSLRDRLAELFGQSAQLTMLLRPLSVTLDLPRLQEEHDDNDRTDR